MAETAVRTPATVFLLPPSFLKTEDQQTVIPVPDSNTQIWTQEQHYLIVQTLMNYGCEYVKGREEYTLLKQILIPESFTEVGNIGKVFRCQNLFEKGIFLPSLHILTSETDQSLDDLKVLFLRPDQRCRNNVWRNL